MDREREYQGGYGGGSGGGGHEGGHRRMVGRSQSHAAVLLTLFTLVIASNLAICSADIILGPVTDYGSSMLQWMRHRRPYWRGGVAIEAERPSPSYIVDVCSSEQYKNFVPMVLYV